MKILIDVCMHTHMGYMRVHLYYDVCALYNVACIREVRCLRWLVCICSSITQGFAWVESHFPCLFMA